MEARGMPSGTAEGQAKSALLPSRSSSVAKLSRRRLPQKCSQSARSARLNKPPTTRAKPLPKHRPTATQAATRSRSLLSRSRVSRAAEAARRVGGGLIVAAALNVSGLRAGAGTPTDAGSERPAGRGDSRRSR